MNKTAPTLNDVAQEAGVSKATAVFVLNNAPHFKATAATRQRVLDAAQTLGYRRNGVAAALSRGHVGAVGVVLGQYFPSATSALSNVYAKDVISVLTETTARRGLRLTVMASDPAQLPSVDEIVDRRVDGLILASLPNEEFARQIYATGFPCVTIGSGYGERQVCIDNCGGARAAARHLIELGHRRLCCAINEKDTGRAAQERLAGFIAEAALHGLRRDHEVRVACDDEAIEELLALPPAQRPTAIFAFNDLRAWKILSQAYNRGLRVPHDFSLVGFDNNILAEASFPPLTTVVNPLHQQAEAALQWLSDLQAGKKHIASPPLLPAPLVVRASTCPPAP